MVFKPGQSGNPKGSDGGTRRKNKMLAEQLLPHAKKFVENLVKLASSPDEAIQLSATKDALDRLYGKAPSSLEISGPEGGPIAVMTDLPPTAEEFAAKYAPKADE